MDVDSGNIHANLPNTGSSIIRIEIRITTKRRDPIIRILFYLYLKRNAQEINNTSNNNISDNNNTVYNIQIPV